MHTMETVEFVRRLINLTRFQFTEQISSGFVDFDLSCRVGFFSIYMYLVYIQIVIKIITVHWFENEFLKVSMYMYVKPYLLMRFDLNWFQKKKRFFKIFCSYKSLKKLFNKPVCIKILKTIWNLKIKAYLLPSIWSK